MAEKNKAVVPMLGQERKHAPRPQQMPRDRLNVKQLAPSIRLTPLHNAQDFSPPPISAPRRADCLAVSQ